MDAGGSGRAFAWEDECHTIRAALMLAARAGFGPGDGRPPETLTHPFRTFVRMVTTNFRSELLLRISTSIVRDGFALIPVGFGECSVPGCDCGEDDGDAWAYTIGLAEQGHPELVVLGLAPGLALELVRWVARQHGAGNRLALGEARSFGSIPVKLQAIPPTWLAHDPERMGLWLHHYAPGRSQLDAPRLAQLLWGDAEGRFPGDPGCDPVVAAAQPNLALDPTSYPAPLPRRVRRSAVRRRSRAA